MLRWCPSHVLICSWFCDQMTLQYNSTARIWRVIQRRYHELIHSSYKENKYCDDLNVCLIRSNDLLIASANYVHNHIRKSTDCKMINGCHHRVCSNERCGHNENNSLLINGQVLACFTWKMNARTPHPMETTTSTTSEMVRMKCTNVLWLIVL